MIMKTKNLVKGLVIGAALVVGTSVAKANAFLEVISGTFTAVAPGSDFSGANDDSVSFSTTIGPAGHQWFLDVATGKSSGLLNVTLNNASANAANTTQTTGLEIVYSSGNPYAAYGTYKATVSDTASDTLTTYGTVYEGSGLYTGSGALTVGLLTGAGTVLANSGALVAGGDFYAKTGLMGPPPYYLTEVLVFGNDTKGGGTLGGHAANQDASGEIGFKVTPVPDGGSTLMLLGAALTAATLVRTKFGNRLS
jgi:hypothetical protein